MLNQIPLITVVFFVGMLLPKTLYSQEMRPVRVVVFTVSGKGFSGYLNEIRIGREVDTLILKSTLRKEHIPMSELAKVIVLQREQPQTLYLAGGLAGTYLATLLIGKSEEQPTAFLTPDFTTGAGAILTACIGFGVAGSIGGLINIGSDGERELYFNRLDDEKRFSRMTLYELYYPKTQIPQIHFSVQGGHVTPQISKEFRNISGIVSNGYSSRGSDFNLLRKMQLTFTVEPEVEIGGAIQWCSEPKVLNSAFFAQTNGNTSRQNEQTFYAIGYFAVGKYKPFLLSLPHWLDLSLGSGIGFVSINFRRMISLYTTTYSPKYSFTINSYNRDVNLLTGGATLFAECNFFLKDYLSLGMVWDYVYFPPNVVSGDPSINMPEQTIRGNSCFGVILGVHL